MSNLAPPIIECHQIHAALAITDLRASIDFYVSKLGFVEAFTWGEPPRFAGVNIGKVQMFLATGKPVPTSDLGSVVFLVGDADKLYAFHTANGVEIIKEIDDRPYGIRDYTIRDLNGYLLVFGHHQINAGEPVKIERVEVTARLEKRLAALLEDLAKHKPMTVGSCMEEIILHTNEGVGPHTKATLRHIQELKKQHGIDYDCHASYRFTEAG